MAELGVEAAQSVELRRGPAEVQASISHLLWEEQASTSR
jgi:hypothetical protein